MTHTEPEITVQQDQMRQKRNGFWDPNDNAYVHDLIQQVCSVQDAAIDSGDQQLLKKTHDLIVGLVQLYELYKAFRDDRNASVNKIASKLGLSSRNGVYFRLQAVTLEAADFRGKDVTVSDLIEASPKLKSLSAEIRSYQEDNGRPNQPR